MTSLQHVIWTIVHVFLTVCVYIIVSCVRRDGVWLFQATLWFWRVTFAIVPIKLACWIITIGRRNVKVILGGIVLGEYGIVENTVHGYVPGDLDGASTCLGAAVARVIGKIFLSEEWFLRRNFIVDCTVIRSLSFSASNAINIIHRDTKTLDNSNFTKSRKRLYITVADPGGRGMSANAAA